MDQGQPIARPLVNISSSLPLCSRAVFSTTYLLTLPSSLTLSSIARKILSYFRLLPSNRLSSAYLSSLPLTLPTLYLLSRKISPPSLPILPFSITHTHTKQRNSRSLPSFSLQSLPSHFPPGTSPSQLCLTIILLLV